MAISKSLLIESSHNTPLCPICGKPLAECVCYEDEDDWEFDETDYRNDRV